MEVSQVEAAVALLRDRIMDLTLEPGSRIDERLLTERFGLGRTPAREAMNRLSAEDFVDLRPNRGGAFVAPLGFEDFAQMIEAHQFCEAMLCHRIAMDHPGLLDDLLRIQASYVEAVNARDFLRITQINMAFHMRFYATLNNAFIETYALKIQRHVARVLNFTYQNELPELSHQDEQFRLNLAQHDDILRALADRDRARLTELLLDHARYVQLRLTHLLNRRGLVPEAPVDFGRLTPRD
ncbi:GntR family transcriptional regulator [Frigidibacter sp. MR17.24]|uniref:GntR family transcriptional regulator n=1 Tax=Frigidibacter sp. MR17.24 TaxID=3127345 RepID=UPI0030131767